MDNYANLNDNELISLVRERNEEASEILYHKYSPLINKICSKYYKYVKDNPITNWNKKTYILYGDKDNMQDRTIIEGFVKDFNCNLTIMENGKHYFHTEEQLNYYNNWLDKILKE